MKVKNNPRSKFGNWKEALEKMRASTGFQPVTEYRLCRILSSGPSIVIDQKNLYQPPILITDGFFIM